MPLGQLDEWTVKPSRFSIQVSLSELSRIIAAKTLKDSNVQDFQEEKENQSTKRKTESFVFNGFGIGISGGWKRKSTTGRFATCQFWPFTGNTSFVGKDKVNKWEYYKLKITAIVRSFCNRASTPFSILSLSANELYDFRFFYFHSSMKLAFLVIKGLLSLYNKQKCWTPREIPYLRAPMFYSLFVIKTLRTLVSQSSFPNNSFSTHFYCLFKITSLRTWLLVVTLFLFPFPLFGSSSQSLFLSSLLYSLHDLSSSLPWGMFKVPPLRRTTFRSSVSTNDPAFFKRLDFFSCSILPSLSLVLLDAAINFRCLGIAPDATSAVEIE